MKQQNDPTHQIRLSIDLVSIKDHEFTAQMYLQYSSIPQLGIKKFRSSPTIAVTNAKVQKKLGNCFMSYMFEAQAADIAKKMENILKIEVWHNDRMKHDSLLGVCQIQLKNVMSKSIKVTNQSYAKVYDVYAPIDHIDQEGHHAKQIGALRVIVYLEDLGSLNLLKQNGFDIKNFIDENQYQEVQAPKLPSENHGELHERDHSKKLQLNELEYKVVWELQTWKKAEQAKVRILLKQRQIQFWTNLSEQQKKSDLEKQKQFKQIQAKLNMTLNKITAKKDDLIKRQQKIIICEQQLQAKLNQVSKELLQKDQEIQRLKKRHKQQKTSVIKEKSILELEISKMRAENAKLRVQIEQSRKIDEKSPINILKNQLNHKAHQIKQLSRQLQKCMETKEQFKIYYEKMKNQVINLRAQLKEKQQIITSNKYQYALILKDVKHLEEQITTLKQQQHQPHGGRNHHHHHSMEYSEPQYMNEKQRLIRQRQNMIDYGAYTPDDQLIKQFDRLIQGM